MGAGLESRPIKETGGSEQSAPRKRKNPPERVLWAKLRPTRRNVLSFGVVRKDIARPCGSASNDLAYSSPAALNLFVAITLALATIASRSALSAGKRGDTNTIAPTVSARARQ